MTSAHPMRLLDRPKPLAERRSAARLRAAHREIRALRRQLENGRGSLRETPQIGPLRPLVDVERDYIRFACEQCGWRIRGAGGAAEALQINPSTLFSRMKKLGIRRPRTL